MNTPLANLARFVLTFGLLGLNAATLGGLGYVALTSKDTATVSAVWPIVNMMVGGLIAWGGMAVSFWMGSSNASERKSEMLNDATTQALSKVPTP